MKGYGLDGLEKKVPHDKTKPDPFTMTRKEESMAKSGSIPKLLPSDAHLSFKPDVDYRKSLNNFYKAKSAAELNKSKVSTTKKAEGIKEMNFKDSMMKEKKILLEQKKEAKKKERYENIKAEFQDKMKNYREEEDGRIRDHYDRKIDKNGEPLEHITKELLEEKVRKRQMALKHEEEIYKDNIKNMEERVRSRDMLITNYDEKNNKRRTRAKLLLTQYNDMVKNGFANPAKFLTQEELMLIEEERMRNDLLDTRQLMAMKKNKKDRLDKLNGARTLKDDDKREIQRLE